MELFVPSYEDCSIGRTGRLLLFLKEINTCFDDLPTPPYSKTFAWMDDHDDCQKARRLILKD